MEKPVYISYTIVSYVFDNVPVTFACAVLLKEPPKN